MKKLTLAEIRTAIRSVPDWRRRGPVLCRTWTFEDFPKALAFVNRVGRIAERRQHHPDIDIRWNRVTLALTTHDAGGLTSRDFQLAGELDALSARSESRR